jgi:hypothetical protein
MVLCYSTMNELMDLFMRGFMYVFFLHILHKTNGLCDFHGVSGETFFDPQLKIEYVDAWVVFGKY